MYHKDDDYFARFNQPSSSVNFPSESVRYGGHPNHFPQQEDGPRFRSHSADARRAAFRTHPRPASEEDNWSNPAPSRLTEVNFPSQRRSASTTPWEQPGYLHPTNNFSEHLRERSPASSSALLSLLSRYPSAQNSVQNSPQVQAFIDRVHPAENRPVRTVQYAPVNDARFPIIEYSVRSGHPGQQKTTTTSYQVHRGPDGNDNFYSYRSQTLPSESFNKRAAAAGAPIASEPINFYNTATPPAYNQPQQPTTTAEPNQLDVLAAVLLDDNMSRSTSEWSKSFGQLQNRFQVQPQYDDFQPFVTSGSMTLPRRSQPVMKSASNYEMPLLNQAIERRAAEAPEFKRSGALDNFWNQTISSRPSSPTVQRISQSLTAAERLQLLQEPVDGEPRPPQRVGSGHAVAARKAQLMHENQHERRDNTRSPLNPSFPANSFLVPNFNDLDTAVHELDKRPSLNSIINSNGRQIGGCARFPTGEYVVSPPLIQQPVHRVIHSPSPPEDHSDSSSVYQIPTGLPHPKPKHNIKEQMSQAGIQQAQYHNSRMVYRNTPNFPVPSTGSVASRITEFEKRPGTPSIQVHTFRSETRSSTPNTNGSMSPRSAVFRSKPVIHVELGVTAEPMISPLSKSIYNPSYSPIASTTISHQMPVAAQKDSSSHSIFDLRSNNVSAATTTQVQADTSPTRNVSLAELNVTAPQKKPSSAPGSRLSLNGNLEHNGVIPRNATSQNDIHLATETLSKRHQPAFDANILNDYIGEQYKPAPPKPLPQVVKPPQPKLVAPKEPFYFPQGKPVPQLQNDAALRRVCEVFRSLPNQKCEYEHMGEVCEAAGLPFYWKMPVFLALTNEENRPATQIDFTSWWKAMTSVAHDEAARFVYTLTMGSRSYLQPEDFYHLVMDVIHTHPGLAFYREATEFHDKYCQVVMTRIFWNDAHNWSGKLTTERLRRGGVLKAIRDLSADEDINKSLRYFSYEHFYVVYCKFWEIDTDHDLKIRKKDLANHAGGALVPLVIDRIFSGAVCMAQNHCQPIEEIGLPEFTQFLLAEEDKTHPTSIEYWFRILDLDGDGLVSLYDMEIFHAQVQNKLSMEGIDSMAFQDIACQLIDMLNVHGASSFRLSDLKKSALRGRFINTFVNWRKFFVQETNEGSESARIEDEGGQELTEWDKYCIEEYEAMMEDDQGDTETISLNLEEEDPKTGLAYHDLL